MNPTHEDRELDEYLSGRSEVSQRYRAQASEEPPAELDRAILSQARAAVETSSSKVARFPGRKAVRWVVPFAVAATVILTFSIVHQAGIEPVTLEASRTKEDASVPMPAEAPAMEAQDKSALDPSVSVAAPPPTANVLIEPPVSPAQALREPVARGQGAVPEVLKKTNAFRQAPQAAAADSYAREEAVATTSSITPAAPPMLEVKSRAVMTLKKPRTPENWLEEIRKLRAAGETVEAEAELKRFLEAHPDYFEKNPEAVKP